MKVELKHFLEELKLKILGRKKENKLNVEDLENSKQQVEEKSKDEKALPSIYKFTILGLGFAYLDYFLSVPIGEGIQSYGNCDDQIRNIMGTRTPEGKIEEIITGICYDEIDGCEKKSSQSEAPCGVCAISAYFSDKDYSKTYKGLCEVEDYIKSHPNKEKYAQELKQDFAKFPTTSAEEYLERQAFTEKRGEIVRMLDREDN